MNDPNMDDNIFGEIEDFLSFTDTPSTPVTTQDESSPATAANPSTPGQTLNVNQYSPGGPGVGCIRGGGNGSSPMLNNGYTSNGCSMTTKAVLGERLRNQLGGRGDHPPSGDLKRKLDEGFSGPNDPIFNKAPKIEIKDEPQSQHGNVMMKTEIKEENSTSQLEAILGLNSTASDMKMTNIKHEINPNSGGGELKSEYAPLPNKAPPTQGGLLQQALMEKRPLVRDTSSSNVLPMFNGGNSVTGGNVRAPGMAINALGGIRNSLESGGGIGSHMDPQALNAIRRLKELAKDPTLTHEAKQAEASKIIKENPKVVQFLKWMQNGKGNQQRTLGSLGSSELFGPLQSTGSPQRGSMVGVNCDQQSNPGGIGGNPDTSMNGGGPVGTGQDFSAGTQCTIQPGSPMNTFNEAIGGVMSSHDIQKQRMQQQQQWEMQQQHLQQQVGGINHRLQHPPPNVMCGPQVGGVPTTQFVHGPGMGARSMGPTNAGNTYGHPTGLNNPNMNYQQAPNMIVGHNGGQNWMRQPGITKPPNVPPPTYPYRTPGNIRMERGNIRGISPTIGGYPTQTAGQSNDFRSANQAFMGSCPPIRGNFPSNSSMNDQYAVRNANCFPNPMYGGSGSTQNMENGSPMSVRLGVGFAGTHADAMSYQNGGQGGPGLGEYVNMNAMQIGRNGQNGGGNGGSLMVSQGIGSPMGHPNEFSASQQRGMMHPNNANMARASGHHGSPGGVNRTTVPHTSPMIQQHLVSQGNVNGIPQNIGAHSAGNCSPAQRMMQVNAPNNGSNGNLFTSNTGIPPPNMTVPESEMHRFGPAPPPNYFNASEHSNEGLSGVNAGGNNFNSLQQSCPTQLHQSHQRTQQQPQQQQQQQQQHVGQVQNSFSSGGNTAEGNNSGYSCYNSKGNGQSMGMDNVQQNFSTPTDNSGLVPQPPQTVNGWKQDAGELRKTLLTRLHQALQSQGNPNAQGVAEQVEREAFIQSSTQDAYTMRLAGWLANVFRQSSNAGENNGGNKTADQQQMQDAENNRTMNPQQQKLQMTSVNNLHRATPPTATLSTSAPADSTTLQEALSRVSTSNIPNSECPPDDSSCKTELGIPHSGNTSRECSNKEITVDPAMNNINKPSLCKANPILADLLPPCSKGGTFESTQSPTVTKSGEGEGLKSSEITYNKASNNNMSCGKEPNSSISTPNAGPPSSSSIYNMPSLSPKSCTSSSTSSSSASSSSSSSPTITITSSPPGVSSTEVRTVTASISSGPTTTPPPSKSCPSPGMAFSGNRMKPVDSTSTSPGASGAPTTTTPSTIPFQSPANFPVPMIDPNENGIKGQHQTAIQAPVVSSATTIIPNNTCMTTTAIKGSSTVTAVRRPSGKGINGQPSSVQAGQIGNSGNVTVLTPSLSTTGTGQLSNTNAPGTGQNNIQPHSVDSGIGSPRSIASSTLYSPKIQGTSPSLNPISETLTSSASPPDKGSS